MLSWLCKLCYANWQYNFKYCLKFFNKHLFNYLKYYFEIDDEHHNEGIYTIFYVCTILQNIEITQKVNIFETFSNVQMKF